MQMMKARVGDRRLRKRQAFETPECAESRQLFVSDLGSFQPQGLERRELRQISDSRAGDLRIAGKKRVQLLEWRVC